MLSPNFSTKISTLVNWLVGGIWVFMGASKVGTDAWLLNLDLLGSTPNLQLATSYFLPWFEVFLGVILISGRDLNLVRGAQYLSVILLATFLPVLGYMYLEGRTDCGCGGPEFMSLPSVAILRNVILIGLLSWTISFSWKKY